MSYIKNTTLNIAITHLLARKQQTLVAIIGVGLGIGVFLFMNSLSEGFSAFSRNEIFKNNAHLKIFREDTFTEPLAENDTVHGKSIIINPQIVPHSAKLMDPNGIIKNLRTYPFVTQALALISTDVIYYNGSAQMKGVANGARILSADSMFSIHDYLVEGSLQEFDKTLNSIIVGIGIAEGLNVGVGDYITVTSSLGVSKRLKIMGLLRYGNSMTDKTKSYVSLATAQQLLKEGNAYVTTIYANTTDADQTISYSEIIQPSIDYKVEPWQVTNKDILSADLVRGTLMKFISLSILIVAAFGIYNILNMTVMQKINDIAILKATGYNGKDIIKVFVTEALIMGGIGVLVGLMIGAILIVIMQNIYMGPPVGNFPIYFDYKVFGASIALGLLVTFGSGLIPALRASKIDPITIFRK